MRAKLGIIVFPSLWRRNKTLFLADITGASHTDKAAFKQIIGGFVMQCQGFRKHSEVVGVTTDDLDETVFPRHQCCIVDATRIRLAKPKFAPLGEKSLGCRHMLEPVNFMLIRHAVRRAINNDSGLVHGLLDLIGGLHTELFKVAHFLCGHDELRTTTNEIFHFGTIAEQRPILMEGNLIEFKLLTRFYEEAN